MVNSSNAGHAPKERPALVKSGAAPTEVKTPFVASLSQVPKVRTASANNTAVKIMLKNTVFTNLPFFIV